MRYLCILLFAILPLSSAQAHAEGPKEFISKRIEQLLAIIKTNASHAKKKEEVSDILRASFDMVQLSGMALGRSIWTKLKNEEKTVGPMKGMTR